MSNVCFNPGAVSGARLAKRKRREPDALRRRDLLLSLAGAPDETLLNPAQVVALSGLAPETLRLWRKQGRGPAWLVLEGMPRLKLGEYRRWLNAPSQSAN